MSLDRGLGGLRVSAICALVETGSAPEVDLRWLIADKDKAKKRMPAMVERAIADVDDATFPLASARLLGGTFRLSGTVESLGQGEYRGRYVRLPIELSVTEVLALYRRRHVWHRYPYSRIRRVLPRRDQFHRRHPVHCDPLYVKKLDYATGRGFSACRDPAMVAVAAALERLDEQFGQRNNSPRLGYGPAGRADFCGQR